MHHGVKPWRGEPRGAKGPWGKAVRPDEFAGEVRLIVETCSQGGLDDWKPLFEERFGLMNSH